MTAPARGWAAIENDKISVKTVSPTRRAAIVNFLVVHRSLAITFHHSDAQIEEWWEKHHGRAQMVEVEIGVTRAPMDDEL